jgi:hypothetical protein
MGKDRTIALVEFTAIGSPKKVTLPGLKKVDGNQRDFGYGRLDRKPLPR